MNTLFVLIAFCLSQVAFAQCSGAPGAYHTNPDSSPGGFVATTAMTAPHRLVHQNFMHEAAMIHPSVVISVEQILEE